MHGFTARRVALTSIAASSALAASLALAGSAVAVAPATATATYDCGSAGAGTVTLTAADSGGGKTIRIDSADIRQQYPLKANTVTATLKLKKTSGGAAGEVRFSGTAHAAAGTGDPISFGPLPLTTGSLSAGDTTDSAALAGAPDENNWSLKLTVNKPTGSFSSYCTATGNQSAAFTW
ncbi:hypothetical protein [Streptomyces huiliensis]|uniref:hypothetical protein n=1 Tax=Streptomyces huiliensis TaxID=2876027 RepID=UPI001CC017F0|nr:hypothetical protein [Streptomyces huiliensis]MBZ4320831.1 hypothetical protein [Streptomyces huiliensis]